MTRIRRYRIQICMCPKKDKIKKETKEIIKPKEKIIKICKPNSVDHGCVSKRNGSKGKGDEIYTQGWRPRARA